MHKINEKYKKTLVLYFSLLGSMLVGVLVSVLNARFLGVAQFGLFKYVQNILNFLVVISSFGFFYSSGRLAAIESGVALRTLCAASSLIAVFLASGMTVLYIPLSFVIDAFTNADGVWVSMMFGVPYLYALFQHSCAVNFLQGSGYIYRLSLARLTPNLFYCLLITVFSMVMNVEASEALVLMAVSVILAVALSEWRIFQIVALGSSIKKIVAENKSYGFSVYLGGVVNVGSVYLASFFIAAYVGIEEVGYYGLAMTLCVPLQMLVSVVGTVMFKSFVSMPVIPNRLVLGVWVSSILSGAVFYVILEPLVNLLYGVEYQAVSVYASVMLWGSCFFGLGEFYTRFLSAKGASKSLKYAGVFSGLLAIFGYWVGGNGLGIFGIIYSYVLSALVYLVIVFFTYRTNYERRYV